MDIRALTFDTGGTVLDWHGGLVAALSRAGGSRGISVDWHAIVNDWRRRGMKAIVGQTQPAFNMDDDFVEDGFDDLQLKLLAPK